jgi:hypothetical protein
VPSDKVYEKPVEHEDNRSPALRAVFRLGVVLVAANGQAVKDIAEDFEPFGLGGTGRAVREERIPADGLRIVLRFHAHVGMALRCW